MHAIWTRTRYGAIHALFAGEPQHGDVVIIPGLGVSAYLRPTVRAFADAGYRCWLVDPPGFGGSADPSSPLDIAGIAEAMGAWLEMRKLAVVTLVGHSTGTQAAARLTATEPGRVARLILGSPTLDPRIRPWPQLLGRWLLDGTREPGSLISTQKPEWRRAGWHRLAHLVRSMRTDDLERSLVEVRCPLLIVRGGRDPLCSATWARQLSTRDEAELVELPGLAHSFPYRQPDAFPHAVRRWVEVGERP